MVILPSQLYGMNATMTYALAYDTGRIAHVT